jgi:photosystem II stability/assembly factor-like uncharacterized protein
VIHQKASRIVKLPAGGIAIAGLIMALVGSADAAGTWTKTGPIPGAFAPSVAYNADGSVLLSGGIGTIFRSTNNGVSWTPIGLPPAYASSLVISVATSPLNKNLVLASTWDVGLGGVAGDAVFASSDGGGTWAPVAGLSNHVGSSNTQYPYFLVWDPTTANTAYASTQHSDAGPGAVYRTTTGGNNWSLVFQPTNINQPFPSGPIGAAPTSPVSLYLAAGDSQANLNGKEFIAQSTNGGLSFQFVEPLGRVGFPGYGTIFTAFGHDPKNPNTVYALASGYQNEGGVDTADYLQFLWSPNNGVNWVSRVTGLPTSVEATVLAINPATGSLLMPLCCAKHNKLFVSSNQGNSWAASGLIPARTASLAVQPGQLATLAAGGEGGVLVTTDGGQSWSDANTGLNQPNIVDLVADPTSTVLLYVGTKAGVLRSTDGGKSFAAINAGLTDRNVEALALDAAAATHVLYAATETGVYSENLAAITPVWTEITPPAGAGQVGAYVLAVDGATAGRLYVSSQPRFGLGQTYRTDDYGAHWTTVGFPPPGFQVPAPTAMIADPKSPGTVYLAASIGIYKSTDAGKTFSKLQGASISGRFLFGQADQFNPRTLYLYASNPVTLTGQPRIMRSTDGGNTWDSSANASPGGGYLLGLAADPGSSQLYALVALSEHVGPSTQYSLAVFQSPNRGFTWTDVTGNLPALSLSTNGSFVVPAVTRAPALWATGNILAVAAPLAAKLFEQSLR